MPHRPRPCPILADEQGNAGVGWVLTFTVSSRCTRDSPGTVSMTTRTAQDWPPYPGGLAALLPSPAPSINYRFAADMPESLGEVGWTYA